MSTKALSATSSFFLSASRDSGSTTSLIAATAMLYNLLNEKNLSEVQLQPPLAQLEASFLLSYLVLTFFFFI